MFTTQISVPVVTNQVPTMSNSPVLTSASILEDDDLFDNFDATSVIRDGRIPGDLAAKLWRTWCGKTGMNLRDGLIAMAVSCAHGTSAETNLEERFLESDNAKSCVARFVDSLGDEPLLSFRENKLRVWCRSMPDFAAVTRKIILRTSWLAAERAADYEMDLQFAGVCFDYAEVLIGEEMHLTPGEKTMIKQGLRYKASGGRPATYSAAGVTVKGSSPTERGVAAGIGASSDRVTRGGGGGSGPFAN